MPVWQESALVLATALNGLMAGLYFAFSVAVLPGLRERDERAFANAMRSINRKILNPWFALAFGGTMLVILAVAVPSMASGATNGPSRLVMAAFLLYTATLVITFAVNVPLNDALEKADGPALAAARERFEGRWVRWNHARTVLAAASLGCLAAALALEG
ncbi:DUF1772 domain-containing protein [Streptomyces oceani]|uniref:DUF1772 domain-containing protein n=1 Tax=Streptomyces oceani TaxID=1075402 RepID=A0A1E7KN97_9ACTN|nr:anthrone oxygenase family protein [Streptomyces oceani]OEV05449.1 hypothetical protein AN216_03005 [Streptomyces oceani]